MTKCIYPGCDKDARPPAFNSGQTPKYCQEHVKLRKLEQDREYKRETRGIKPVKCKCGNKYYRSHGEKSCETCRQKPPKNVVLSQYKVNPPRLLPDGTYERKCQQCGKVLPWNLYVFRRTQTGKPGSICTKCKSDTYRKDKVKQKKPDYRSDVRDALPTELAAIESKGFVFGGVGTGRAISEPGDGWRLTKH